MYWIEFESGRAPPVPWYFTYFQAADRCNCRPWDLIPVETPVQFWHEAAMVVAGAEADHMEFQRKKNENASPSDPTGKAIG